MEVVRSFLLKNFCICDLHVFLGRKSKSKSVGLKKEDAKNRARWRVGVEEIAGRVG